MKRMRFDISGMTCDGCTSAVNRAVTSVSGVDRAEVKVGSAQVAFDEDRCNTADIVRAIQDAGFAVGGFRSEAE